MPITPRFRLSQTLTHVLVDIRVPHVRVTVDSVEVVLDGPTLHFASPPYLLVLTFPHALAARSDDDDGSEETAKYDPSKDGGMIYLELKKKQPLEWPDLDLLANLVQPKQPKTNPILRASVVSEERYDCNDDGEIEDDDDEDDAVETNGSLGAPCYGFLGMFHSVFTDLTREGLAAEMVQIPHPDQTEPSERRQQRLDAESERFDHDRYLGDLDVSDDYLYQVAMAMTPHWKTPKTTTTTTTNVDTLTQQMAQLPTISTSKEKDGQEQDEEEENNNGSSSSRTESFFTESERMELASIPYPILPRRITQASTNGLLLGLLDILFAYVYDHLLTDGDATIESSWTITTLSCLLSWFETYSFENENDHQSSLSIDMVVRHSTRRALIYPYLRNYDLSTHCFDQVLEILQGGRHCVVRCLLQTRRILHHSECHYLGNRLYIDPYLAWVQRNLSDGDLGSFTDCVGATLDARRNNVLASKESLRLGLPSLEKLVCADDDDDDDDESSASSGIATESLGQDSDCTTTSSSSSTSTPPPTTTTTAPAVESTIDDNNHPSSALLDSEIGPNHQNLLVRPLSKEVKPRAKALIEELT